MWQINWIIGFNKPYLDFADYSESVVNHVGRNSFGKSPNFCVFNSYQSHERRTKNITWSNIETHTNSFSFYTVKVNNTVTFAVCRHVGNSMYKTGIYCKMAGQRNFELCHPLFVSSKLNYGLHVYIIKHNYRLGGMLIIICKTQLHVSVTNFGHLQVVQGTKPWVNLCDTIMTGVLTDYLETGN